MQRIFKIVIIIVVVVLLCAMGLAAYLIFFSRNTQSIITNHSLIGQTFTARNPAYYLEDCNNVESCGNTPREREIGRELSCNLPNESVLAIYETNYQLSKESEFTLVELIEVTAHGLNVIGGEGYVLAVLRDQNGILSTKLFSALGQTQAPIGFEDGKICEQ